MLELKDKRYYERLMEDYLKKESAAKQSKKEHEEYLLTLKNFKKDLDSAASDLKNCTNSFANGGYTCDDIPLDENVAKKNGEAIEALLLKVDSIITKTESIIKELENEIKNYREKYNEAKRNAYRG